MTNSAFIRKVKKMHVIDEDNKECVAYRVSSDRWYYHSGENSFETGDLCVEFNEKEIYDISILRPFIYKSFLENCAVKGDRLFHIKENTDVSYLFNQ